MICDRREKARVKVQVHETVRPISMHGLEMVALSEREEEELEIMMLRFFIESDGDGQD